MQNNCGFDVGSYVDPVLEIIDDLQNNKHLQQYLKDDLDWVADTIISQKLKKKLANKIFGYLARCEFWIKLGLRFWIFVGYVQILPKFVPKLDFGV